MKMAEMYEVCPRVGLDAVRDWIVCCHYNKKVAYVFSGYGYGSINSIISDMTEHDCNRIGSSQYKILWSRVKRLRDIPEDKISQELLVRVDITSYKIPVRVTRYLKSY